MWSNGNLHSWLVQMEYGAATIEYSLAASYDTVIHIFVGPSSSIPRYWGGEGDI